ncbi:MAG: DUF4860 domain-containing protein [Acetivibrio ethanolgignens]
MKNRFKRYYIEGVFVFLLFTIFAGAIIIILSLGTNSYRKLVERDNRVYDKHLGTSYVAAKIRGNDIEGAIAVGGFVEAEKEDGIETLHIYENIDGEWYDTRIYYYAGAIRELFTFKGNQMDPEDGIAVIDAKAMKLLKTEERIIISITDVWGNIDRMTVGIRSGKEVKP